MKPYKLMLAAAFAAFLLTWSMTGRVSTVRAHAENGYTNAALQGTLGFSLQGTLGAGAPVAGYGILVADGNGGLSGTETIQSPAGLITRTFQGSYVINPDGTGTLTMLFPDPPSPGDDTVAAPTPTVAHFSFVMVDDKKGLRSIQTDAGAFVSGYFEKQ